MTQLEHGEAEPAPTATSRSGAHQVLLLVYAVFTLSAGARSLVQLATKADEAPVAYTLSLLAAVTYALGWVGDPAGVPGPHRASRRGCSGWSWPAC